MRLIFFLGIVTLLAACQTSKKDQQHISATDVFTENMDTTANPASDFFQYANGGWIRDHKIPADESAWGIGYIVNEENNQRIRNINEEAFENTDKDEVSKKIGFFWKAAMDSSAIESQGLQYIQPYLDSIKKITDLKEFINAVVLLQRIGVNALMGIYVGQDDKISDQYAVYIHQGGLGLPERDYYFRKDSSTAQIRKKYVQYLTQLLNFIGNDSANSAKQASEVYTFETRLAMFSRKLEDLRDPYKNYNKTRISDLSKLTQTINWPEFLQQLGVHSVDSVIVGQPEFLKSFQMTFSGTSINTLKNYLTVHLIDQYSEALPAKYVDAAFGLTKLYSGAKEQKPRWKRVLKSEESVMGELVGQLYVKKYFDSASKNRYLTMAKEVSDAYAERIKKLEWMSDSTKEKALLKLNAITRKIGYPDKWKDFSTLQINDKSYVLNLISGAQWWQQYNFNKLGKPVDRGEWFMFPQTYNAYYNSSNNEIVFPAAAFIVPGFQDHELDDAVMYGYAGASYIGHEITHGFDDQGRLYDANGNLHNWWTPKDSSEFAKRAQKIIQQFDQYEPVPGYHINGKATQGENIADLGGIEIGLDAFMNSKAYKENKIINGFTPMQRFFMGYALSWLYEERPESLRSQLMTDVHSPSKYRVNGPLSDVTRFYETYHVKSGDKMYRADSLRVKIW